MSDYKEFGPNAKGIFPVQDGVTIIGSGVAIRLLPDGGIQVCVGKHCGLEDYVGNRVATVGAAQAVRLREHLPVEQTEAAQ